MSSTPSLKKENTLTPEAFGKFLNWLSADREQAAEIYLDLRRQLVRWFIVKGCAHSEELTDETLDRVVFIVSNEPDKYSKPIALCCGVAKNVWLEYLRKVTPDPLEPDEIPARDDAPCPFDDRERECLACCLRELPDYECNLITEYHNGSGREKIEKRKRLAIQFGGMNTLRVTTYRIRVKLNSCIKGCVRKRGIQ